MIQIGNPKPQPTAFAQGLPADLDKVLGRTVGDSDRPAGSLPPADAEEGVFFVSPPPLPWPRVFPGL